MILPFSKDYKTYDIDEKGDKFIMWGIYKDNSAPGSLATYDCSNPTEEELINGSRHIDTVEIPIGFSPIFKRSGSNILVFNNKEKFCVVTGDMRIIKG